MTIKDVTKLNFVTSLIEAAMHMRKWSSGLFLSYGDEENGHRACTNGHLTTADQSEIRKAYLASVLTLIYSVWRMERNARMVTVSWLISSPQR